MKNFKKLIPAFAMLLVSAILMGTSTFAWFSMNTKVTATGMQVKASTATSLVISNEDGSVYDTTAADKNSTTQSVLTPVSTNDLINWFYVTNPLTITSYSVGTATSATIMNKATSQSNYYKKATFKIKLQADSTTDFTKLFVSNITVTDNGGTLGGSGAGGVDQSISFALRVGVKCGSNSFIYAPTNTSSPDYKAVVSGDGSTTFTDAQLSTSSVTISSTGNSCNLISSKLTTTPVDVEVYIWYEGQDANCTSEKSVNVENLEVAIEFSAEA